MKKTVTQKNLCSVEEGLEVNKKDLLLDINNQCSEVQSVIAQKLHNPDDTELLDVLNEMLVLLNRFLEFGN